MEANAKLNLSLALIGKEGGYHTLQTLMCVLEDYYDVIEIKPHNYFEVKNKGNYKFEGKNILEKVADLFKEEFGGNVNFSVNIVKNIKTGGGLGGGSSNAGFFLHFLLLQNNISLSKEEFCKFAMKVGADVPFFYDKSPKICTHYGEVLNDVTFEMPKNLFALLVLPDFEINTAKAFSLVKHHHFTPNSKLESFEDVLKSVNPLGLIANEINPEISVILRELKKAKGVLKADVSGSGATCFALFLTREEALEASKNIVKYKTVISKIILDFSPNLF
jgi:4-diphosphocytidyl-2-C-methyl-D-erythritol kinase